MNLVIPAVLATSKRELEEKLVLLSKIPSISRIQIDVVDGKFAKPASWPYTNIIEFRDMVGHGEMLPHLHQIEYEIDLMCADAGQSAGAWLALGASRFVFHAEGTIDLPRSFASLRKRYGEGSVSLISLGVALNVASDVAFIEQSLDAVDFVQFMGIAQIGRQGQPFDQHVLKKIRAFRMRHPKIPVQVDGGVSLESAKELVALGVTNLVIGSAIIRANNPAEAITAFERLESPFGV